MGMSMLSPRIGTTRICDRYSKQGQESHIDFFQEFHGATNIITAPDIGAFAMRRFGPSHSLFNATQRVDVV